MMVVSRASLPELGGDHTMRRPRLRFSLRTSIVAVAIAAVFSGCLISFLRTEGWLGRPIELAPLPPSANTDHDLFDIVFSDLLENKELSDPDGGTSPQKTQILIDSRTYVVTTRRLAQAIGDQAKKLPEELQADLVSRNSRQYGYSLARYQPSNPDILVDDMAAKYQTPAFGAEWPNVRGCVWPTLPGYSRDGRMALVFFACSLSGNNEMGYYLLQKEKGRWQIMLKGFYALNDGAY
jgi:hypothetical protein